MMSMSKLKRCVVIARDEKTVTLSYEDIMEVVYRDCDEVLLGYD